jgi:lysophospholipase L1-like esterase
MDFPEHITRKDTVFLGNSLTEGFDLAGHFGRDDLINRGMSGNLTQHVYYRLEEITKIKPAAVFLMIGINDILNGVKKEVIVSNIQKIIDDIIRKCPDTNLYLQSVLPVNETNLIGNENLNIGIYELNNSLRILCKQRKISFIDIHPDFLNDKGEMNMKYTYDGVHLTKEGYLHWAELLKDFI